MPMRTIFKSDTSLSRCRNRDPSGPRNGVRSRGIVGTTTSTAVELHCLNDLEAERTDLRRRSAPRFPGRTCTADSSVRRPEPVQCGSHIPSRWPCRTSYRLPCGTSVLPFSLGVLINLVRCSANGFEFDRRGRAVPRPVTAVQVLRMQAEFVEQHRRHVTALTDLTVDDNVAVA